MLHRVHPLFPLHRSPPQPSCPKVRRPVEVPYQRTLVIDSNEYLQRGRIPEGVLAIRRPLNHRTLLYLNATLQPSQPLRVGLIVTAASEKSMSTSTRFHVANGEHDQLASLLFDHNNFPPTASSVFSSPTGASNTPRKAAITALLGLAS